MEPNFFIAGGSKCGTTNLSYHLMEHEKVFMPDLNEPYYFCRLDIPRDFERESMITEKNRYLELFKNAKDGDRIGEATSAYLHCPSAPSDIKNHFPDSKIIILVRDPVERAHSAYFSYQFMHSDKRSFSEMIDEHENKMNNNEFFLYSILDPGFYSKHITRYQDVFDKEHLKIIIFEDYIKNTERVIESVLDFLELDKKIELRDQKKGAYRVPKNKITGRVLENKKFRSFASKVIPTVYRQKFGDKFLLEQTSKPNMMTEDRYRLKEIYKNEVVNLEKLLELKLPWKEFIS